MDYIIKISPRGTYILEQARYVGSPKSRTYPTSFDKIVIVGVPHESRYEKGINYTASILIHGAIKQNLDGYAYIFKSEDQNVIKPFSLEEAKELIDCFIERVGGKRL